MASFCRQCGTLFTLEGWGTMTPAPSYWWCWGLSGGVLLSCNWHIGAVFCRGDFCTGCLLRWFCLHRLCPSRCWPGRRHFCLVVGIAIPLERCSWCVIVIAISGIVKRQLRERCRIGARTAVVQHPRTVLRYRRCCCARSAPPTIAGQKQSLEGIDIQRLAGGLRGL